MEKPLQVFCCYAREDRRFLSKLKRHLKSLEREEFIIVQADIDVSPGEEWEKKISGDLNTAHIILLLISPDFIASDYCYSKEMKRAMERHADGEARVVPIVLRSTDWRNTQLGRLNALPTDAEPVTSSRWGTQDKAFLTVVTGIRKVVGELLPQLTIDTHQSSTHEPSSTSRKEALAHYLHSLIADHKGLNPKGMHQSQVLISVNVPLDEIFIDLKANPDTPVYDIAELEDPLLNSDLGAEQREELRQKIHIRWESQKGQNRFLVLRQQQQVRLEEILQDQEKRRQASVLLGAPGSGKSTALRWLTLRMTQALLPPADPEHRPWAEELSSPLLPLLPVFLRIGDYAKWLIDQPQRQQLPFKRYLEDHLTSCYSALIASIVREELQGGRCLLLLDGLDEVADNTLRHTINASIHRFLRDHIFLASSSASGNRCIITSRIVGYEKGDFTEAYYTHYTLLELEEKQITAFLTAWCPAVELFQARALDKTKELSPQQEQQAKQQGLYQKERLLQALQKNPRVKRLAVNPLMLTILALVQRSNKLLPQRRIELYDIVTYTLLETWNQDSGRAFFTGDNASLAERLLGALAYRMHGSDPLLSLREVRQITREIIAEQQERDPAKIPEQDIDRFINTIRHSSGLFVESGLSLFSFMHRTFQEYYVARFLLNMSAEKRKTFIADHYHLALWREPLLLTIAAKSNEGNTREETSNLLTAIMEAADTYDTVLQHHLLFAASCVVDCGVYSIKRTVQIQIANGLFDLYGDTYGHGRYKSLRKEIEEVALAWLQVQEYMGQDDWPALLTAWRDALCNVEQLPERQEGAACLLATIAPDLPTCPESVLSALLPPLIVLAGVQDMCFPPDEIEKQLKGLEAQAARPNTEEYALIALRLLDDSGPAGWLHAQWLQWSQEQPELLARLSQHSLELDSLLTPAALPFKHQDPNWDIQDAIEEEWQRLAKDEPRLLQERLLTASTSARFPHAYLLKELLEQESDSPSVPWSTLWDTTLCKEMAKQRSATYQTCLNMRLLLYKGDTSQQSVIAKDITDAVLKHIHIQPLIAMTNIYIRDVRDMRDMRDMIYVRYMREVRNVRGMKEVREMIYMREVIDMIDMRYMIDMREVKYVISNLCSKLNKEEQNSSPSLLLLYVLLDFNEEARVSMQDKVKQSIQLFKRQSAPLSSEHVLLINNIQSLMEPAVDRQEEQIPTPPDALAERLVVLKRERRLTREQVGEILAACVDTRSLSEEKQEALEEDIFSGFGNNVQNISWSMFNQPLSFTEDALPLLIERLGDPDAMICAMATRFLRNAQELPQEVREKAMDKIMVVLEDVIATSRSTPYRERVDDVLFETLEALKGLAKE